MIRRHQYRCGFLAAVLATGCIAMPPSALSGGGDSGETPDVATPDMRAPDSDLDATVLPDASASADLAPGDVAISPDVGRDARPQAGDLLFVAGDAAALTTSDAAAIGLLGEVGYTVEAISDDDVGSVDPNKFRLVVVSKTASSSLLGTSLRQTTAGMLLWENRSQYFDYFGLINSTSVESLSWSGFGRTVTVEANAPAEIGVTGTINVYSTDANLWFVPETLLGPGAQILARPDPQSLDAFAYVYESGAMLPDGSGAAGRRAYLGIDEYNLESMTLDGQRLFRGLARYAGGR